MIPKYPIIALTGPRQSGKTTLTRQLFPAKPYVSLENPEQRQFAIEDPKRFLAQFADGAVIDEVQRVPSLLSWLQGLVDDRQRMDRIRHVLSELAAELQDPIIRAAAQHAVTLSLEQLDHDSLGRFAAFELILDAADAERPKTDEQLATALSGWLLGGRATMCLLALTGGLFGFFLWADARGALPVTPANNHYAYAAYLAGIVGLTATATLLSRRSYLGRVGEAQDMAADLAARDTELRKLLRVVEQSPESTVITDLQGRIEFVNDAFVTRTGYARSEVLGQLSSAFSGNGLAPAQLAGLQETLARGESWAGEQANVRKDGVTIWESVVVAPIRQPDGRISHHVELKQDMSERKRAAEEIHRLAHFDPLTSLPNRSMLIERLTGLQARHQRAPDALNALLLLDLDRFTTFNDARGSEMGDRLLCAVALRLSECLGGQDLLVRVAADEFGIVLHGLSADAAAAGRRALVFAEQVAQALAGGIRPAEGAEAFGLDPADARIAALDDKAQKAFVVRFKALLEGEAAVFDMEPHRNAPPGLRLWCGCTVETADVIAATPWLEWAFETAVSEVG